MITDHYTQTVSGVDQSSFMTPLLPNLHNTTGSSNSLASLQSAAAVSSHLNGVSPSDAAMAVPRCLQTPAGAGSSSSTVTSTPATHNTAIASNSVNRRISASGSKSSSSGRGSATSSRWSAYLDATVLRSLGHAVLGVASNTDKALVNGKQVPSNSSSKEGSSRHSAHHSEKHKKPSASSAPATSITAALSLTPAATPRPSTVSSPSRVFALQPAQQPQSDPSAAWAPSTVAPSTPGSNAVATRRWVDAPSAVVESAEADEDVEDCARVQLCDTTSSVAGLSPASTVLQPECAPLLPRTLSISSMKVELEVAAADEAEDEEEAAAVPRRSAAQCASSPPSGSALKLATFPTLSVAPRRFSMADIADELRRYPRRQHPFLDMTQQRRLRDEAAARDHLNYHVVKSFQTQLTDEQQSTALKCLLNGAHRRQFTQCMARTMGDERVMTRKVEPATSASATAQVSTPVHPSGAQAPSDAGHWGPRQRRLLQRQWRVVAEQAECDMYREGWVPVQRKLSCMCLFNPDTDVRIYQDSTTMREQRIVRQHRLLRRLHQQLLEGGNPFFLQE